MRNKKNDTISRRLKKSEVKYFIERFDTKLHDEYSNLFFEDYGTGFSKRDLVYELANGDFIYVFDPNGQSIPGKGNYWERTRFLRFVRWVNKVNDDRRYGRTSSVDHWSFYSKQGCLLIKDRERQVASISRVLDIDSSILLYSYHSLGVIDAKIEEIPYGRVWEDLYDALVYYVGEVIIRRVGGIWNVETTSSGRDYPYVTIDGIDLHYMPINIVWEEISGLNPCNLRKATADEVKRNALWHPRNKK